MSKDLTSEALPRAPAVGVALLSCVWPTVGVPTGNLEKHRVLTPAPAPTLLSSFLTAIASVSLCWELRNVAGMPPLGFWHSARTCTSSSSVGVMYHTAATQGPCQAVRRAACHKPYCRHACQLCKPVSTTEGTRLTLSSEATARAGSSCPRGTLWLL